MFLVQLLVLAAPLTESPLCGFPIAGKASKGPTVCLLSGRLVDRRLLPRFDPGYALGFGSGRDLPRKFQLFQINDSDPVIQLCCRVRPPPVA